jgi:DNA-binding MarR family transcriptional regulator
MSYTHNVADTANFHNATGARGDDAEARAANSADGAGAGHADVAGVETGGVETERASPGCPDAEGPAADSTGAGGRADLSSALGMDTAGRVMGKLFALAPRLVEVQDLGAREYGMSYARGRVVAALTVSGPALMRALSQAVGVTPRTITGLIDALEADGWVERRAHPTDRRATIVALTPAAEVAFARLNQNYGHLSQDLVGGISEADLHAALRVIEHIAARLDDAISRGTARLEADPPVLPRGRLRPRSGRPGSGQRPA